ncbi:2TM domain-containing protein [Hymenobacter sp. BT683]|uniref:2TM domain-containing protein n=1 Tax=Hymenobacter jeongseonensis TaxID=2791027 RepID=A0ABS0IEZ6_9BACT|nr:2TM domain-containing protein [Hymenobacter jeongseonensis]MBF9236931.1 2TM domain-containing protein [Hymenobacter jeongseonensis]
METSHHPARNPYLWRKAKSRAKFRTELGVYVLVNAGLWVLWALTSRSHEFLPWPAWVSFFWGVGLVIRGVAAYGNFNYEQRTQHEYERLLRQHKQGDFSRKS